jgi:hypothetical protein
MKRYYPILIEAVIEFKIYSRQIIAEKKKEKYNMKPEDQTTYHSNQFILKKDPSTGYIYCLKKGQTISERKKELALISIKPEFDKEGNVINDPPSPDINQL